MRHTTLAVHCGQTPVDPYQPVITPIYQTTTFEWNQLETAPQFDYARCGNPNCSVLAQVLAALEGAKYGLVTASGMSAIQAALSLLRAGDGLMIAEDIYGGTYEMAHVHLKNRGINIATFDSTVAGDLTAKAIPGATLVVFETPTNPTLKIANIVGIANEAKALGLMSVFDNTFATPILQNPLGLGIDIVVHSTTKYIGGHSDVTGGAVLLNDAELFKKISSYAINAGASLSPFEAWLTLRGLKTMELRMKQHCHSARAIAEFLNGHPKVRQVNYPGLPNHPGHTVAEAQMKDFGGMLSADFDLDAAQMDRLATGFKLFALAGSLGGVESLIGYPRMMSHRSMSPAERLARGIPDSLLRFSIGIENTEDLLDDIDSALKLV